MFLIGYTEKYRELGWHLKKVLELDKEKVILVKIKPEADGENKDIFEIIHYDNQGVSHAYSEQEIKQMIMNLLATYLDKLVNEILSVQLPN